MKQFDLITISREFSLLNAVILHEIGGFLFAHAFNVRNFVTEFHSVKFVPGFQQFGSESGRDELSFVRLLENQVRHGFPENEGKAGLNGTIR